MPKGGARENAGRPAIWDTEHIRAKVSAVQSIWWRQIEKMLVSRNSGERKFALSEINKLQIKAMPSQVTGEGGGPVQISLTSLFNATGNE